MLYIPQLKALFGQKMIMKAHLPPLVCLNVTLVFTSPGCCVNSLNGAYHVTTACIYDQPPGPADESSVTRQHRNSRWQINVMSQ